MGKLLAFPVRLVEHDTCPNCGALNGPFERLGSGICNECLSKRAKRRTKRAKAKRSA